MQIKSSWYEKSECLALSFIIHIILLLVASLHQEKFSNSTPASSTASKTLLSTLPISSSSAEQTFTKSIIDPLSAPLINAPCILYRGNGTQKNSVTPSSSEKISEKIKISLDGDTEDNTTKNIEIQSSDVTEKSSRSDTESTQQHVSVDSAISSIPVITTISSPSFLHSNEPLVSNQTTAPTSSSDTTQQKEKITNLKVETVTVTAAKKTEEIGDGTRKRKLQLSDLFKNLSLLPFSQSSSQDTQEDGDGNGAPSVIIQGDIRYHSFVGGIVDHINNASKHRHGDAIIGKFIQSGTIKQNLKLSITLEKSGKVLDARILISSGCSQLDSFWITTAYEASPFAPLPSHFKRDMVRVELATQL